jgi:hypothetical protein
VATAAPALPSTGLVPDDKTILLNIAIVAGILVIALVSFVVGLKRRRI